MAAKKSHPKKSDSSQSSKSDHSESKDMSSWRPGSDADHAKDVASSGDFGVPAGSGSERDRQYVSENTKRSDPGNSMPAAWEHEGVRDHGAGAADSGAGSASGGDIDTDFVGVGTGGTSVSASGPDDAMGADETDGSTRKSSSPVPSTKGSKAVIEPASGRMPRGPARGSTINRDTSAAAQPIGEGSDAATNPARGDDSFAGEISSGEARGEDLGTAPSSDS